MSTNIMKRRSRGDHPHALPTFKNNTSRTPPKKKNFFVGFVRLFSSVFVILALLPVLLVHMGHLEIASLSGTLGNIKYSYSLVNTQSMVRELDSQMAHEKARAEEQVAQDHERQTFFDTPSSSSSKLKVIVTGMEHTGTHLMAELLMSVPGLNGPFESGFLLPEEPSDLEDYHPWYEWLERKDPPNEFLNLQPQDVSALMEVSSHSDMYNYVMAKSPLFQTTTTTTATTEDAELWLSKEDENSTSSSSSTNTPTTHEGYVDHTPFYSYNLVKIIQRAPPKTRVVVLMQTYETVRDTWISERHGHTLQHFEESHAKYMDNLEQAQRTFPYQIRVVHYEDLFETYFTQGDRMGASAIAQDLFEWLQLPWDIRYFTGESFNAKQRKRTCSLCDMTRQQKLGINMTAATT